MKRANFLGKKLLVLMAHPDDESYTIAGTLVKNFQVGGEAFLICATNGEKGKSHLARPVSQTQLKILRQKELKAVARLLKVRQVIFLNLPDGALADRLGALYQKAKKFLLRFQPEVIVSFAQDGISGHLDHISIGKVAERLAAECHLPFVACCAPPNLAKNRGRGILLRRRHGKYAKVLYYEKPNVTIKINSRIKLKALRRHRSQLEQDDPFRSFHKATVRQMLSHEYFKV